MTFLQAFRYGRTATVYGEAGDPGTMANATLMALAQNHMADLLEAVEALSYLRKRYMQMASDGDIAEAEFIIEAQGVLAGDVVSDLLRRLDQGTAASCEKTKHDASGITIPRPLWSSVQTALMNASVDLNDASSVVDAGEDREYAYQDTLELLKGVRDRIDEHEEQSKRRSPADKNAEERVEMQCADEGFALRTFVRIGDGDELDYVCEHCGFMQQSTAAGAGELCRSATWHDKAEYAKYAAIARSGGQIVPDEPPNTGQETQKQTLVASLLPIAA